VELLPSRRLIGSASSFLSGLLEHQVDAYRYVINAARAAKTDDPNHVQRVLYVSVSGCLTF
jgi:hypothetical protein